MRYENSCVSIKRQLLYTVFTCVRKSHIASCFTARSRMFPYGAEYMFIPVSRELHFSSAICLRPTLRLSPLPQGATRWGCFVMFRRSVPAEHPFPAVCRRSLWHLGRRQQSYSVGALLFHHMPSTVLCFGFRFFRLPFPVPAYASCGSWGFRAFNAERPPVTG